MKSQIPTDKNRTDSIDSIERIPGVLYLSARRYQHECDFKAILWNEFQTISAWLYGFRHCAVYKCAQHSYYFNIFTKANLIIVTIDCMKMIDLTHGLVDSRSEAMDLTFWLLASWIFGARNEPRWPCLHKRVISWSSKMATPSTIHFWCLFLSQVQYLISFKLVFKRSCKVFSLTFCSL